MQRTTFKKLKSWAAVAALVACGALWAGCDNNNDNKSGGGVSTGGASTTDNLGSTPNAQSGGASGNSAPAGPVQQP